jgi:hypothetical protein
MSGSIRAPCGPSGCSDMRKGEQISDAIALHPTVRTASFRPCFSASAGAPACILPVVIRVRCSNDGRAASPPSQPLRGGREWTEQDALQEIQTRQLSFFRGIPHQYARASDAIALHPTVRTGQASDCAAARPRAQPVFYLLLSGSRRSQRSAGRGKRDLKCGQQKTDLGGPRSARNNLNCYFASYTNLAFMSIKFAQLPVRT